MSCACIQRPCACRPASKHQRAVDKARCLAHKLGYRPYQVRLVWQVQDQTTGKWSSDAGAGGLELELMPVLVHGMSGVDVVVEQAGRKDQGFLRLSEISPAQVDEATLMGWRDGKPWADGEAGREFFYEVQQELCEGATPTKARRMIPASAPELRADSGEWIVRLSDQFGHRTPDGVDQTVPGDYFVRPPRIVT